MKTAIAVLLAVNMLALVGCGRSPESTGAEQRPQAENYAPAPANETGLPNAASSAYIEHKEEISRETAQDIALKHAGLTENAVNRLHTEYDRDRINHFEVSFHYNGYEYDYDIHAETGEILDLERELDD